LKTFGAHEESSNFLFWFQKPLNISLPWDYPYNLIVFSFYFQI
jgi:hypothetical protein